MAFLIDSLKEKLGKSDDDGEKGFSDMKYVVGNTSGMNVGQTPGPIDQRIGRMAQLGGEIQEVLINNPTTFSIDRKEMMNTIRQLGIDITLHGSPNIGFDTTFKTGNGAGYMSVHNYFSRYLEQVASFRHEALNPKGDGNAFDVRYINMHASTKPIPSLEGGYPQDVSVDPFGFEVDEPLESRDGVNIYDNKEFLGNLFEYFLMDEADQPQDIYNPLTNFCEAFEDDWERALHGVSNDIYDELCSGKTNEEKLEIKATLLQSALGQERSIERQFDKMSENIKLSDSGLKDNLRSDLSSKATGGVRGGLHGAIQHAYRYADGESYAEEFIDALHEGFDKVWKGNGLPSMSISSKLSALQRRYNVQGDRIVERATHRTVKSEQLGREEHIRDLGRLVFMGDDEYWEGHKDPGEEITHNNYKRMLEQLLNRSGFSRVMNLEANMYYKIIPAWMRAATDQPGDNTGMEEAKLIWDTIVEDKYGDRIDFDDGDQYNELLNQDKNFRMDVVSAVAACYLWGHFTQEKWEFNWGEDTGTEYTWVEWMQKHGVGVNIETVHRGMTQTQTLFLRLWRSKDIVLACRAINKTARKQSSDWDFEYEKDLVKFTIDMEHLASFGIDPYEDDLLKLIEDQRELARKGVIDADPEKPLADIMKTYHLTKPGWENREGHRHGPFARGDTTLYKWLHTMVDAGFTRNDDDLSIVMFEVGGEYREEIYVTRVAMDLIQLGVDPEDLDPSNVPMDGEYKNSEEALMARFFGLDQPNVNREWAKIEQHAFDPLKGLLEAEDFDYTHSGQAAIQNDNRPGEWMGEEYK